MRNLKTAKALGVAIPQSLLLQFVSAFSNRMANKSSIASRPFPSSDTTCYGWRRRVGVRAEVRSGFAGETR